MEKIQRRYMAMQLHKENNGLCGNGGFWQKTEEDIPKNIEKSFGKHFK